MKNMMDVKDLSDLKDDYEEEGYNNDDFEENDKDDKVVAENTGVQSDVVVKNAPSELE